MQALTEKRIYTQNGEKVISVHACDIRDLDVDVDIMTVSAFYRDYGAVPGTMFSALMENRIDVEALAEKPEIDLRDQCNIWLSREIDHPADLPVKRVGCIELTPFGTRQVNQESQEAKMLMSIQAYFRMLDIASLMGISVERILLPALGAGNQNISADFISLPLLNECIRFLKSNQSVKHIMIVTRNHRIAFKFAMTLEQSYAFHNENMIRQKAEDSKTDERRPLAFISYSSKDRDIAEKMCAQLESRGIGVWYAPRDITSTDYASAIVEAITKSIYFVVILSHNSIRSNHVLNEIDLAFSELQRGMKILPVRIDEEELGPAFLYYLSRQQWIDAHIPPIELRFSEMAEKYL